MNKTKVASAAAFADQSDQYSTPMAVVFNLGNIGGRYDAVTDTVVIERRVAQPSEELVMALRVIAKEGNEKLADEVMDQINKIHILEDIIENARIEM